MTSEWHHDSYPEETDDIVIGVVRGVRGIRGELRIEITTDILERFQSGQFVTIMGEKRKIVKFISTSKGGLLHLDGVVTRDMAETLIGEMICVPYSEAVMNPKGSYFHHQLIGIDVFNDCNERLGVLTEIILTGANDVYVVTRTDKKDLLIPAVSNVIQNIDVSSNMMLVQIPEGLDPQF